MIIRNKHVFKVFKPSIQTLDFHHSLLEQQIFSEQLSTIGKQIKISK